MNTVKGIKIPTVNYGTRVSLLLLVKERVKADAPKIPFGYTDDLVIFSKIETEDRYRADSFKCVCRTERSQSPMQVSNGTG